MREISELFEHLLTFGDEWKVTNIEVDDAPLFNPDLRHTLRDDGSLRITGNKKGFRSITESLFIYFKQVTYFFLETSPPFWLSTFTV